MSAANENILIVKWELMIVRSGFSHIVGAADVSLILHCRALIVKRG